MSGGGGSSTNTVQSADPWGAIQPYLTGAASDITSIYQGGFPDYYPGQTYLDPNAYTQAALQGMSDYAGSDQLAQMISEGMYGNMQMLSPFSSPYSSAVTSIFPGMSAASSYGVNSLYPSLGTSYDMMNMLYPSMSTGSNVMSMLYPSMGGASDIMSGINPSMQTALALQGMGLNYNPGFYTPDAQIMNYADPTGSLQQMMSTGGMNPYLDQMVGAAQQNALQNYGMTTQQAADAYETGILPQIQDARTLIQDALTSFTDEALPQITDNAIATGTLNSTRTDLAEGTALAGVYDSLNRELSNLARTADITGSNVYQDILRNQSNTLDDVNALASSMYGGAWDTSNQNILNAANIGAGMTSDWQNAILQSAGMDLERQIANQSAISDWANLAFQSSNMLSGLGSNQVGTWADLAAGIGSDWSNLAGTQASGLQDLSSGLLGQNYDLYGGLYDTNMDSAFRGLSLLPTTIGLGTYPSSLYDQVGAGWDAYNQAALQADIDRYNYYANAPMDWASNYANMMGMLGGLGGGVSGTSFTDASSNPMMGALSGAMLGGYVAPMLMSSAAGGAGGAAAGASQGATFGPYGALAGALIGYLMS